MIDTCFIVACLNTYLFRYSLAYIFPHQLSNIAFSSSAARLWFFNSAVVLRDSTFLDLHAQPDYSVVVCVSCSHALLSNLSFSRLPPAKESMMNCNLISIEYSTVEITECLLPPSALKSLYSFRSFLNVTNTMFLGGMGFSDLSELELFVHEFCCPIHRVIFFHLFLHSFCCSVIPLSIHVYYVL